VIYTVGHTELYERRLTDPDPATKLGRQTLDGEPYNGGSVWRTREEAQAWLDANPDRPWSVYGVEADWDTDTEPSLVGEPWHDLLHDSRLVRLP
jgi:hypothetical protein